MSDPLHLAKSFAGPWRTFHYSIIFAITAVTTASCVFADFLGTTPFRVNGTVQQLHKSSGSELYKKCRLTIDTKYGLVHDELDGDCPETLTVTDEVSLQVRQGRVTQLVRPIHGTLVKPYNKSMFDKLDERRK